MWASRPTPGADAAGAAHRAGRNDPISGTNDMSRLLAVAALAMAIACSVNCLAASSEDDLLLSFGEEEFLSIATGQKQLIAKAPAVASVITAEDIETLGASTLEEVLETVPGVHVSLSSTYLSPIYSIRGIYTDKNPQVLMLVNGVPLTNAHFGDRGGRSSFPVRDIARIEVIRGPGSAVYGADALAGVINVITKSAEQIGGTEFGVRAGSFDTTEGWLLNGTQWGELEVAFSLQTLSTDGDDGRRVGSDAQSVFDAATAPFFASVSRAPGPLETGNPEAIDLRLDLKYRNLQLRAWNWRQDNTGVGPGLALALDPKGGADGDNYLFDLSYQIRDIAPDTTLELRAAYMDINIQTKQTLFPAGAVLPIGDDGNLNINQFSLVRFSDGYIGNPEFYEEHTRLDAILNWNGLEKHSIRVATGYNQQQESGRETKNFGPGVLDINDRRCRAPLCVVDGTLTNVSHTPYIFIEDQDRDVWYASLQDQWQIANDWNLTAGVRYDDYSDFGSTVNPRVALVWDTSTDLTTKLLYGRAFRAPLVRGTVRDQQPGRARQSGSRPRDLEHLRARVRLSRELRSALRLQRVLLRYQRPDQVRANQRRRAGRTKCRATGRPRLRTRDRMEATRGPARDRQLRFAEIGRHHAEQSGRTGAGAAGIPARQLARQTELVAHRRVELGRPAQSRTRGPAR